MTNGEKLINDFPYIEVRGQDEVFTAIRIDTTGTGTPIIVYTEWWNAEYKKPHIKGDYYDGFKNGLRTAEWRYDKMKAEIEKTIWEESVFDFYGKDAVLKIQRLDPKVVFEIIDKYKTESEE